MAGERFQNALGIGIRATPFTGFAPHSIHGADAFGLWIDESRCEECAAVRNSSR